MSTVQTQVSPAQAQVAFISSSIGKKIFQAITGLFLFLFVTGHMVGNLQIFLGQDQLNTYAQALKNLPALIWSVRILMFIFFA
ncbi:MAG: succinate dehydrogenase, partial [candidate division Zixibacteria bacterium]|nr:succinate dehydrogenase [candidate division Zixibacteria bacterium]